MGSSAARLVAVVLALVTVVLAAALLRTEPGPYVVTAIDYHFHDAHPTLPIEPGRALVVKNAGRNVHNVTIPALQISEDVRPGDRITIPSIGDELPPGRYPLICNIHDRSFGMTGTIVISSG